MCRRYSPETRSWRFTIERESRRVFAQREPNEERDVIMKKVGMKPPGASALVILASIFFCFSLGAREARGQFGGDGSSGFRLPIPMGGFSTGSSKESSSLEMESVLQKNFIADQLTVDGNMVYWVNRGGSSALRYGKLRTGELAAEGTLSKNYDGQLLTADQGLLYWVNFTTKTVHQAEIRDGELRNAKIIAENIPIKMLAADSGNLYWQEEGSQELLVGKVVDGKLQRDKVLDKVFRAKEFAVDRGTLYWVDRNTRTLQFKKLNNDKNQALSSLSSNFTGKMLVVDNNTFYWVNQGKDELCYGRVR